MANISLNIAKGRAVELYRIVKENVLANAAIVLVPIEASGVETDAVIKDKDTLADVLSGTTNEQTTMGRKTLTDAEVAALPAPDDVNDRFEIALPTTTWSAAAGNPISDILVCVDLDTTSGTDASIIPVSLFDFAMTPSGADIQMTGAPFYRAGE